MSSAMMSPDINGSSAVSAHSVSYLPEMRFGLALLCLRQVLHSARVLKKFRAVRVQTTPLRCRQRWAIHAFGGCLARKGSTNVLSRKRKGGVERGTINSVVAIVVLTDDLLPGNVLKLV